ESRIFPRESTHSGFAAWWLGAMLFASLAAATLLVTLEWEHYRRILNWHKLDLTAGDRAIVGWLLWSKTVLPLLSVLAVASLAAAWGRRKGASLIALLGSTSLLFWLASDLVLQRLTGSHLLDYLPYATDALTAA